MASDQWQQKIPRYVDTELSGQEMREMDAHLRECASCASEALRQVQLKHETKLAGRRYTTSPAFRQKITSQIAPRRSTSWRWVLAPVLATALVASIAGGVLIKHASEQARSSQLLAELTDLHVTNLAASTPVDVVSSDRHTVKPWFQGKLPFSFNLPELTGSPFTLVGGRVAYLDHEPGAHLIHDIGAHHISVFIFREQPQFAQTFAAQESSRDVLNFHMESWSTQGLRYFVVGDANEQSISELAELLKKAQ